MRPVSERRQFRVKAVEWMRRYLCNEIAGTTVEMVGATVAYLVTDSLAAAAIVASIGASVGYYAAAYVAAVRLSFRAQCARPRAERLAVANLLALRSVLVEFGPAELLDSIFVRPLAFYLGPQMFGNVAAGWVFGKLVSDLAFYAAAIFSYERFTSLLVVDRSAACDTEPAEVPVRSADYAIS
ncbi:hypothetical protein [Mycolicibacterium arenosum]|uniref:GtrA-like protein domain-containing protein n=1 Tax=Mycolicibacterium arenosum TaxID=2952157 RepID=A0ABT1M5U6_9MYCO|nr:hypothetical protein [Mycolicibacterium sp. CAU 1645]MCP9274539.1 hypothetical protein [Mycolicibacterium sp. CAU 1645]